MSLIIILFIIIVALISFVLLAKRGEKQQLEFEDQAINFLREDGYTIYLLYRNKFGIIGLTPDYKYLIIINSYAKREVVKYETKDVIDCELIIDNQIIFKKSAMGSVTGGLLAGTTGAIIGLSLSSTEQRNNVKKIYLKIFLDNILNPSYNFTFADLSKINEPVKNDTIIESEKWKDRISLLIEKNKREQ